jgi:3-oxoacyl-[acyl-carrier-protein] synthase-3
VESYAGLRSVIQGYGAYLPEKCLTNDDLAKFIETSDEWITQRTGIKERRIADPTETTADLAFSAAQDALKRAHMVPEDIDLIVCATSTPDRTIPAVATIVQSQLGIKNAAAFDVQAACAGFIYVLSIADKFLISGTHRRALVIGVDIMSRLVDWEDRSTCVLFGDGAGAVVIEAVPHNKNKENRGILGTKLCSDGSYWDKLYTDDLPGKGHLRMMGREVFRSAVEFMSDVAEDILKEHHMSPETLDWFIPHQANQRIIEASRERLGIPPEKVIQTVAQHGNTSAASIPLALAHGADKNLFKKGDIILMDTFGAGFTWGGALIRW